MPKGKYYEYQIKRAALDDNYLMGNIDELQYTKEYLNLELKYEKIHSTQKMKRITWVECPGCKTYSDQKVVRSDRNSKFIIIRRRECYECGHRWETIQYPEMIVSKQQAAYARCE